MSATAPDVRGPWTVEAGHVGAARAGAPCAGAPRAGTARAGAPRAGTARAGAVPGDRARPTGLLSAPGWQLAAKRAVDVVGALAGLLVLLPVLLGIAVAVGLTSPGGVFYRHPRVGRDGRQFRMLKFRSMFADAHARRAEWAALNECSGPVFKIREDPRVTPVGRWLRRASLDELPQLWNVLRGEMSLVGPRPPLPEEVARYTDFERERLRVRPGLTCIWQVSGRSTIGFDRWVEMDLEYIRTWTVWLDLVLLVRTLPAVLSGRGAY